MGAVTALPTPEAAAGAAREAVASDTAGQSQRASLPPPSTAGMDLAQFGGRLPAAVFDLLQRARAVSEAHWPEKGEMQLCTLLSIKTGGCSEDCGYCAQSARYSTGVQAGRLMGTPEVLAAARRARENGSTRFCMGAAWKGVRAGDAKFNQVLDIVREVAQLGMEVCVTLGQLSTWRPRSSSRRA